jgi:hypothetical protein
MLIFQCTDCKTIINGDDIETEDQILDKLEQHVAKCPLATFTFEATTESAREREHALRAALIDAKLAGKIRLQ